MKTFFLLMAAFLFASACTDGDKTILFECEQNTGEACNKIGKKREGAEAIKFFRRACDLDNTNGCVNLGERIKLSDRPEALRVLKKACDRGNTDGCVKFAELMQAGG
ncbi:MAG: sel1 repeat family protein [Proteobacteria bacterium]|nr:MAG: sel1 repeat family protein [Pseudomonadota bacterium]